METRDLVMLLSAIVLLGGLLLKAGGILEQLRTLREEIKLCMKLETYVIEKQADQDMVDKVAERLDERIEDMGRRIDRVEQGTKPPARAR